MSETSQEPTEFTAEDILNDYKVPNEPIPVMLPDGRTMTFKPLPTTKARTALDKRIDAFLGTIPAKDAPNYAGHFIASLPPMDYADMRFSAELHLRALAPIIRPITAFALHQAPTVVAHIRQELDLKDKEMLTLYYQHQLEVARGKSEIPGNEEGSSPAESPSQGESPTT